MRAELQLGLGNPHLTGQAQVRELVCGASVVMGRQQTGIDTVWGGVELNAQQTQCIHAKADGALGVS
ncbi:hypothetical protein D3C85_1427550 [compost metagenome]